MRTKIIIAAAALLALTGPAWAEDVMTLATAQSLMDRLPRTRDALLQRWNDAAAVHRDAGLALTTTCGLPRNTCISKWTYGDTEYGSITEPGQRKPRLYIRTEILSDDGTIYAIIETDAGMQMFERIGPTGKIAVSSRFVSPSAAWPQQ